MCANCRLSSFEILDIKLDSFVDAGSQTENACTAVELLPGYLRYLSVLTKNESLGSEQSVCVEDYQTNACDHDITTKDAEFEATQKMEINQYDPDQEKVKPG